MGLVRSNPPQQSPQWRSSLAGVERKLAAILSADVAGYSRLMAADEEDTLRTLTAYREQLSVLVRQHRGRVVDAPGDNLLAEFPSALDATRCALEIQRVVGARNAPLPSERRMEFRIGVHPGDVMLEGEQIYGDGVNIAARLEGLARPGGVCISAAVRDQVETKLDLEYDDLGEQSLKNIAKPVRIYGVRIGDTSGESLRAETGWNRLGVLMVAFSGLVVAIGLGVWLSWPTPLGLVLDWAGVSELPVDPAVPDKPSIVVLPFVNMSADPEQEYFSDGMTEEVTNALARHSGLFVISRSSAFSYKGKSIKVEDVSRELGVRYVLEGSVRKAGERIRVTAQLIDASSGFHLWSEQYDA
ncbi:MAG: adenylate/guanylate cyclase domain-containing protein, partial [Deltaproteobacteria bacterium]